MFNWQRWLKTTFTAKTTTRARKASSRRSSHNLRVEQLEDRTLPNATVTGVTTTSVTADKAANGATPGYTALPTLTIAEGSNGDFADTGAGTKTLVLTAPSGWQFE